MTKISAQTLRQLVDAHAAALTLYARQWCRAPEDALQDALIDLLRQNQLPDNPTCWLYTTVRRRAMNLARSEQRRAKHQQRAGQELPAWFTPAESNLEEPIDFELLLSRLPILDREIVVARVWGELSFGEIADLVKQPLSTVHRRHQRALAELGRMLQELESPRQADESKPTLF